MDDSGTDCWWACRANKEQISFQQKLHKKHPPDNRDSRSPHMAVFSARHADISCFCHSDWRLDVAGRSRTLYATLRGGCSRYIHWRRPSCIQPGILDAFGVSVTGHKGWLQMGETGCRVSAEGVLGSVTIAGPSASNFWSFLLD